MGNKVLHNPLSAPLSSLGAHLPVWEHVRGAPGGTAGMRWSGRLLIRGGLSILSRRGERRGAGTNRMIFDLDTLAACRRDFTPSQGDAELCLQCLYYQSNSTGARRLCGRGTYTGRHGTRFHRDGLRPDVTAKHFIKQADQTNTRTRLRRVYYC